MPYKRLGTKARLGATASTPKINSPRRELRRIEAARRSKKPVAEHPKLSTTE
jgi:hypothetical protein